MVLFIVFHLLCQLGAQKMSSIENEQLTKRIKLLETGIPMLIGQTQKSHAVQVDGLKARLQSSDNRVKYLEAELKSCQERAERAEAAMVQASFATLVQLASGDASSMPLQSPPCTAASQLASPASSVAVPYEPAAVEAQGTAATKSSGPTPVPGSSFEARGFPPITAVNPAPELVGEEAMRAMQAAHDEAELGDPFAPVLHPSMQEYSAAPSPPQPPTPSSSGGDDVELRAAMEVATRLLATAKQESDMATSAMGWIPEAERKALADKAQDKLNEAKTRIDALETTRVEVAAAKMQLSQAEAAGAYVSAAEKKQISEEAEARLASARETQRTIIAQ